MRASPAEEQATEYLRQLAGRRDCAYAVKRRTNGTWRGVIFSLGDAPKLVCLSRETRMQLVAALARVVADRWVLKPGRPPSEAKRARSAS